MNPVLVVGVGNADRGDDGVGLRVLQHVRDRAPAWVRTLESPPDAAALIEGWRGFDDVIVVDAMRSGAAPGTVVRLDAGTGAAGEARLGPAARTSHGLGVADAIALARVLGCLPPRLVIYAVEAEDLAPGAPLAEAVAGAAVVVARRVLDELGTWDARSGRPVNAADRAR